MDLRDALQIIRGAWIIVLGCVVLALGAAFAVTSNVKPVYSSTSVAFVGFADVANTASGYNQVYDQMPSYLLIATLPPVLKPVIKDLRLDTTPAALATQVTTTNPENTNFIYTTVTGSNPNEVVATANAIAVQLGVVISSETAAAVSTRGNGLSVTVVDPAVSASAAPTQRTEQLLISAGLGLLIGLAIAFLRAALDRTVRTTATIERVTGAPQVGTIGKSLAAANNRIIGSDHASPNADAFRIVRTNVQQALGFDLPKVITITSAGNHEGKSTTACNLAVVLAQRGSKVALIDADLRQPSVAEYLELPSEVGLTEVLTGAAALEEALLQWSELPLMVLPAGNIPANPADTLDSINMQELVLELRSKFDYVILDTPATVAVTDAALLSRMSDGVVMVARYGRTTTDSLGRAARSLEPVHGNLIGTVLTFAPGDNRHPYASARVALNGELPLTSELLGNGSRVSSNGSSSNGSSSNGSNGSNGSNDDAGNQD